MAFPIIPKKRSGATGSPTSLELGELAVNTQTGQLFLGTDSNAVVLLNPPTAAGTTATEATGNGTTTAFTFSGYNGTADGGYLVSVGGIDQPPSKYSVTDTAGGTLTFVEAPTDGELISIRAIVAGSGGGGDGNAIQIQGRDVASTAPTNAQFLAWNATTSKWEPQGGGGSVTFNTVGTHLWSVPASVRYAAVSATAGDGSAGTAGTNGASGATGADAYFDGNNWIAPTTGANGANGEDGVDGATGKSVSLAAVSLSLAGGSGGAKGLKGFGGGGSGGGGTGESPPPILGANGSSGSGTTAGGGGAGGGSEAAGGAAGGGNATAGTTGGPGVQGQGGQGDANGGNGGSGGYAFNTGGGGGGGGGFDRCGGGGGGGSGGSSSGLGTAGTPGAGGTGTQGTAGTSGQAFTGAANFSAYAGGQVSIVISEGAGSASITITY